ncbi:hypothetical protein [Legionella jordanis]|uniref:Uncharacterized protein n=1 Tax=Legionella jordanis TaxID=456 RepID=A0A0W0VAJ4_9GAMM|nr:hypothetical protein [Legionella jordanis]KTD17173.1 hypothetical protein Ljor_1479 [Legionella jordanis]RMX03295.1 hypothetical protein EAW55_07705 [Legionella jordanis]VEH12629.1 Uncharacterised protein [Legionella jordanis]
MSEEQTENDLSEWLSTYGLITAERILERYKIRLQQQDLIRAIKSPNTFYHRVIRIPLKNVLNGIILQQAHDYQVYAQKLFIDYLLSGETSKGEDSPGGFTRDDLEKERQNLIQTGEEFHEQELSHNQLIAETQRGLIKLSEEWHKFLLAAAKQLKTELQSQSISTTETNIIQALNILLIMQDFSKKEGSLQGESWSRVEAIIGQPLANATRQSFIGQINTLREFIDETTSFLNNYAEKIKQMSATVRAFRKQFYNLILRANELIKLLPEYRVNDAQVQENRESLLFDTAIGEQS